MVGRAGETPAIRFSKVWGKVIEKVPIFGICFAIFCGDADSKFSIR